MTCSRAPTQLGHGGHGRDMASLLLGSASSGTGILASKLYQNVKYNAVYFHDDFRVNHKLTLNMGIRYEYETGLRGKDNALLIGFDTQHHEPDSGDARPGRPLRRARSCTPA